MAKDPLSEPLSHVLRFGGTESLHFALRVSVPGLYLLSFRGAVDPEEHKEGKELGAELPTAWTGSRYVFVDEGHVIAA
jgi:hypothetical protein